MHSRRQVLRKMRKHRPHESSMQKQQRNNSRVVNIQECKKIENKRSKEENSKICKTTHSQIQQTQGWKERKRQEKTQGKNQSPIPHGGQIRARLREKKTSEKNKE
jgi:hypothetical protein